VLYDDSLIWGYPLEKNLGDIFWNCRLRQGEGIGLTTKNNHYAKQNCIAAQVVLQNFMFERFPERLSRSEYRQKSVIRENERKT